MTNSKRARRRGDGRGVVGIRSLTLLYTWLTYSTENQGGTSPRPPKTSCYQGPRIPAHVPLRSFVLLRHALVTTLRPPLFEWMLPFTCVLETICISHELI